jgi:hypothetical protein
VSETGLGFAISMDYNKFRELLKQRTKDDKFLHKAERKKRKDEKKDAKQTYKAQS